MIDERIGVVDLLRDFTVLYRWLKDRLLILVYPRHIANLRTSTFIGGSVLVFIIVNIEDVVLSVFTDFLRARAV